MIDGAPQAADLAISAIKAASFILISVQPSLYDIGQDLVDLVKQRIEVACELPRRYRSRHDHSR